MTTKMKWFKSGICFIMQYLFFYIFALFIEMLYYPHNFNYLSPLWVGIFLVVSFGLRYFIRNNLFFSILQLSAIAIAIPFCKDTRSILFSIILVFALECFSFYNKLKEQENWFTPCSPACLILNFAALLYAIYLHQAKASLIIFLVSVFFLMLYLCYIYFHNLELFFAKDAHTMDQLNKMLSVNHHLVILFFVVTFIVLFAFYFLHLGDYLLWFIKMIIRGLLYAIMWIISIIPDTPVHLNEVLAHMSDSDISEGSGNKLAGLFFVLVTIIIIFVAIYYSIRLLFRLYRYCLQKNAPKTDRIEYIKADSMIDIISPKKRKKATSNKEHTPLQKLRSIYRKKITTYRKQGVIPTPSSTPNRLNNQVYECTKEDISTITQLYNKGRYSADEITKEDLKQI